MSYKLDFFKSTFTVIIIKTILTDLMISKIPKIQSLKLNYFFTFFRTIIFSFLILVSCNGRNQNIKKTDSVVSQTTDENVKVENKNNQENSITGNVIGISDGDTFTLLFENGFEVKVRLNQIDCPEKKQPFSNKAKQELSNMIFNKQVRVDYTSKDRYGRVLGDVYIGDLYVNGEMIKKGMAWHYKKYSDDKYLVQLEIEARNKKIGLWQDSNAIPPWEFRKK